ERASRAPRPARGRRGRSAGSSRRSRRRRRGGCASRDAQARELAVVLAREQQLRRDRADEREEHVPLRVPGVALRAEEGLRRLAAEQPGPPPEELVGGADRERAHRDEREEPPPALQGRGPQQELAGEDRRHEALREVAEPVVGITREVERVLRPEAERHARVRVVAADDEDERVQEEQAVGERRQREAPPRRDEDRDADEHREDLEPPCAALRGREARPDGRREGEGEQHARLAPRGGRGGGARARHQARAAKRAGESAAASGGRAFPSTRSATRRAVIGASRIPLRWWPAASTSPGAPGTWPTAGSPSGVAGRRPDQAPRKAQAP